jgi:replicative DNA helicase
MENKLFSEEYEKAVLSTLLKNPELYYGTGVRFFMMSSTPHQTIYHEIELLNERQLVPDAQMVVSSLESSGNLDKAGGKRQIDSLLSLDYNKENLKEYASFLIASYKGRVFVSEATKVKTENLTLDNIEDSIRDFKRTLDDLSEASGGGSTVHIGDGVKKAFDDIVARTSSPGIRGATWGIKDIDTVTGGKCPGDLWIIGGRPGSGKSAIICNSILADGMAGIPVLFFEKEMNYQTLIERLVAIDSGVSIQGIRLGMLSEKEIKLIGLSMRKIREYPIYIDTSFSSDIHYMESTIYKYKSSKNISVVYLDYLQLLSERGDNQTAELGQISRMCKLIANDQNVCVVAASQLNRGVEMRDNKRPLMSDLRQSGNLEEDADYVVGLYRDEYYNPDTKHKNLMEYMILKARNGPIGTITLKFNPETNKAENYKQ